LGKGRWRFIFFLGIKPEYSSDADGKIPNKISERKRLWMKNYHWFENNLLVVLNSLVFEISESFSIYLCKYRKN
jgi:hypothetical protein